MNALRLALVSCGFLGCMPVAPGTFGTLGGVLLAWCLRRSEPFMLWTVCVAAGVYLGGRALGDWAEAHAGKKDPSFFVLDEVVGFLLTVLWVRGPSPLALVVGFLLFRLFDVLKPPPARRLQDLGGADGILLDDVAAGLYALAVMAVLRLAFPELPWSS